MSYSVVSFTDGVCVVLNEWMVEDKTRYLWPINLKSNAQLWRALKDKQLPDNSWDTYDVIEHLDTYDSLEKANRKAAESKVYTDVQSDEESLPTRKRRKHAGKKRSVFPDDDDDTDNNDSDPHNLAAPPPVPASLHILSSKGTHEQTASASQEGPECVSNKDQNSSSSVVVRELKNSDPTELSQNSSVANTTSDHDVSSEMLPSRPASTFRSSPSCIVRSHSRSRSLSKSPTNDCNSGRSTSQPPSMSPLDSRRKNDTARSSPFSTGSYNSQKDNRNSGRSTSQLTSMSPLDSGRKNDAARSSPFSTGSYNSQKDNGNSGRSTSRLTSMSPLDSRRKNDTARSSPFSTGSYNSQKDNGNSGRSKSRPTSVSPLDSRRKNNTAKSTPSRISRPRSNSRSRYNSRSRSNSRSRCNSRSRSSQSYSRSQSSTGSYNSQKDNANSGKCTSSRPASISPLDSRRVKSTSRPFPTRIINSKSRSRSRTPSGSHSSSLQGSKSRAQDIRASTPPEVYDEVLFQRKMLRFSVDIKVAVNSLVQSRGADIVLEEDVTDIASLLPMNSKAELTHMEDRLRNEEFKKRVIVYLARFGGGKVDDAINTMCHKCLTDSLAVQYSYFGKGKMREAFSSTTFHNVMFSALRSQKKFSSATEENLKITVSKFLNRAKERLTAKEYTAEKRKTKNIN